jgi:hypothetical protein
LFEHGLSPGSRARCWAWLLFVMAG